MTEDNVGTFRPALLKLLMGIEEHCLISGNQCETIFISYQCYLFEF